MRNFLLAAAASLLLVHQVGAVEQVHEPRPIRDLIAAAVAARIGGTPSIEVDLVDVPATEAAFDTATPVPGTRLGAPARFTLSGSGVMPVSVIARITVIAEHVVARQPIARSAEITADAVEVQRGAIDGVQLAPLPALNDVIAARPRRAIAAGEVFTQSMLERVLAVRAGDEISVTIRSGVIEARGRGRAVSSGFVGDIIRISRPGSRETLRARIVAPASVEILQ